METSGNRLEIRDLSKAFGGVQALSGIDFSVQPGEIVGLVGENGAGKSTLINIATGVHQPDSGTLLLGGQPVQFASPRAATQAGIAVVHQEAELFADLSLAENMLLGPGLPTWAPGLVDWTATFASAESALADLGEPLPVRDRARTLSLAQRVIAQIAAALHQNATVLFLDEPTASLTHKECQALFAQVRRLRDRGLAVVYVSHRLEEVLALCDRVTVLRDGRHVWTRPIAEVDMDSMVQAMVGRKVEEETGRHSHARTELALELESLSDPRGAFQDISLSVRKGEIVGLYGLVGAGRSELAQAVFGLRETPTGTIRANGRTIHSPSPGTSLRRGLAYLPEDRLVQGVFRDRTVRENASIAILPRISTATLIHAGEEKACAQRIIDQTQVKTDGMEVPIENLSGGNQQKVVLGRWLETHPEVLILDEPTRGVDVGAKSEIHRLVAELAADGKGVLLISSELPEVMSLSDRVVVMSEGRLVGEFDPRTTLPEAVAAAAFPVGSDSTYQRSAEAAASRRFDLSSIREAGIGLALFAVMAGLAVMRPEQFLSIQNLIDVLSSVAILSVLALGATFVIGAGGIDISVGSMLGLAGAASGLAALNGYPPALCVLLALAVGSGLGALNMGVSLLGRIHPIIVTLAGLAIYRGLMRELTGGYEISGLPPEFRVLGDGITAGVPHVVWVAFGLLILGWIILQRSTLGRQILAVGNSKTAAAQIGLPSDKLLIAAFALNGAFVGLAAVLWCAYYGKIQSNAGEGYELQAIAAAVIGGANIMGGSGTAVGTFLGACLIGVINNGLILLSISSYWQSVFVGLFILITVLVDGFVNKRAARSRR